ncbi:MAG: hypothetical protein WDM77_09765 [Steroidobacteraceae bacterium]
MSQFELDQALPYEEQAKSIVAAVARGQLDIDAARALMDMIVATLGFKDMDAFLKERTKLYPSASRLFPVSIT